MSENNQINDKNRRESGGRQAPRRGGGSRPRGKKTQNKPQDEATPRAPRARRPQGGKPEAQRHDEQQASRNASEQGGRRNNRRRPAGKPRDERGRDNAAAVSENKTIRALNEARQQERRASEGAGSGERAQENRRERRPAQQGAHNGGRENREPRERNHDGGENRREAGAERQERQDRPERQERQDRQDRQDRQERFDSRKDGRENAPKRVQKIARGSRKRGSQRPLPIPDPEKLAKVETVEDVRLEIAQIEKEITLEIAEIASLKLT